MTFKNSIADVTIGFGNCIPVVLQNVALSGTTNTITIPASGSFAPTLSKGYVRVHVYGGGGTSPTVALTSVTFSDGTNTVLIAGNAVANTLSATASCDFLIPFELDINATSCVIVLTLAGTSPTATADCAIGATT